MAEKTKRDYQGAELLATDAVLNNLHLMMLETNGPAPEFKAADLESAQIKLENFINHGLAAEFSKEEEIALLYSPQILKDALLAKRLRTDNQ